MALIMNFEIPAISLSLSQTPIPKHPFQHALTLNELKKTCVMEFLNSYFLFNFSNKSRTLQTCTLPISQFTLLRPI